MSKQQEQFGGPEKEVRYEIIENGDIIEISGGEDMLLEIGAQVYRKLGGEDWKEEEARNLLSQGTELRPQSMAILVNRGKLYVDVRNFRGNTERRKMILETVKSVLE